MEEEVKRFIQVWASAIISVCYCYYLPPRVKAGVLRLLSILPVCVQFFVFPMLFSHPFLVYILMFFLTGMGTLKLILFAFDKGPLFPLPSNLLQFICFTCFPIKKLEQNTTKSQPSFSKWVFATKVAIYGVLSYMPPGYKPDLPKILLWGLYPLEMYVGLDTFLALLKFLFTITIGCDLEPVFNEPYLATSLQDFWGRRWNPMFSSILWSGVYAPMQGGVSKNKSGLAKFMATFAAFIVSGLFHELMFFYTSRTTPSGGITLFYVLQGACTAAEMVVKRTTFGRRWAPRPAVSWMLTMVFMVLTSGWLYYPQIFRNKKPSMKPIASCS